MSFEKERREKLLYLSNYLGGMLDNGGEAEYSKILDMLQFRYGVTAEKANEYIRIVVSVNNYRIEEGRIKLDKKEVQ